jgi:predicted nucleic acid-binding protein
VITAVDTSVLLDIFSDDPLFRERSMAALRACLGQGQLIACDVVWAEVAAGFATPAHAHSALAAIPVFYSSIEIEAATSAGVAWRRYRARGGPRDRIISDFLIGAHAAHQADHLLTRDRGFHRLAFETIEIIDPAASG